MPAKTSTTHPLQIASVAVPGGGTIGMTFCPGKQQKGAATGDWKRDLDLDVAVIKAWGAGAVVTLMEQYELERFKVPDLGAAVTKAGMTWYHLPIRDVDVPDPAFEAAWASVGPALRERLAEGGKVLLHCRGGLGRTGTIAARLLVEAGVPADKAIAEVRAARPGAIETKAQEAHVRAARKAEPVKRDAAAVQEVAATAAPTDVLDRARGAFLGLAVGDALGTTIEFKPRDTYPRQTEMTGGGPFHLEPGQWTDDTSMAVALADSLIGHGSFDPQDVMQRFVRWWKEGTYSPTGKCFDIGNATSAALGRFTRTGKPFAGSTAESAAGNGSLMRLAPIVLHALHDPEALRHLAAEQSRTTHGAPQAVEACVFFADLLRRAILGEPKATLLEPGQWDGHPAMAAVAAGGWRNRPREEISSSGYVIHTLEAALWAVHGTDSFEEAVVLAVNLGDDADTVGAVTGQLAGALYGYSRIPERWLAPLAWRPRLLGMADSLLRQKGAASPATRPVTTDAGVPDLLTLVARHGAAITRLQAGLAARSVTGGDELTHAIATDAADFVCAFVATAGGSGTPGPSALRGDLVEAIAAVLRARKRP